MSLLDSEQLLIPGFPIARAQHNAIQSLRLVGYNGAIATTAEDLCSNSTDLVPPTQARLHTFTGGNAADTWGVRQQESNTAVGTITLAGNAKAVVTCSLVSGSPRTVTFPVALNDAAATWAEKARVALAASAEVAAVFTVGGTGTTVLLTAITPAANDAAWNVTLQNDTSTGITDALTSSTSISGVAPGTGARTLLVEGISSTGAAQSEIVQLLGATAATTVNTYTFINKLTVLTAGSGGSNVGVVTATAATDSSVSATIGVGMNQSQDGFYMVPANYTAFLTNWNVCYAHAAIVAGTGVWGRFGLAVKPSGGVYTIRDVLVACVPGCTTVGNTLAIPIRLEAGTVVKMRALSTTITAGVAVGRADLLLVANSVVGS